MPDGKVDFSGVWNGGGPVGDVAQGLMPGEEISLTPWGKKIMDSRQSKDDPEANCLPTGIPRIAPYPWRMIQSPTHIFYLFEGNIHSYRQIFIDGAAPGGSRSHLVWRFHRKLGRRHDGGGHHRFQRQILVRFPRPPAFRAASHHRTPLARRSGNAEIETQIIDPMAYTKPFKIKFTATLRPGEELMEYICQENQQDTQHIQGPAGLP